MTQESKENKLENPGSHPEAYTDEQIMESTKRVEKVASYDDLDRWLNS